MKQSNLQSHLLQQFLSSLHPLGNKALDLTQRLGRGRDSRFHFSWTSPNSRAEL